MQQLRKPVRPPKGEEPIKVNTTIKKVKKGDRKNVETEGGEFLVSPLQFDGFPATFKIKGPSHAAGGVDLNLPDNSFVFSDDHKMKLEDEDLQKDFGKRAKESGYTYAELAKQYDINEFRRVLADPNTDKMQRETAEMMIKNQNEKLGKLAILQESEKSFPQGIPFVAIPYLEMMGIDPAQFVNGAGGDQATVPTQSEEDIPQQKMGGQIKIRIKKLPEMQKGGPTKPKDQEFAYNPEFYAEFAKKLRVSDISAILPASLADQRGMVNNLQPASGKNVYGRKNWTDPSLFNDFKARNDWYFQQNPDFDPSNPADVKDFQQSYNTRAQGMGRKPYFDPKQGAKYAIDGKFGEVTYSVPNLDLKTEAEVSPQNNQQVQAQQELGDIPATHLGSPYTASTDNPFWTEDIVNMAGAFGDLQRIKKYMPWQAGYDTVLPKATYYDPTRELAANSEQANVAAGALGAFAGPQELSARLSSVQGQGFTNAANILGKYNDLNVGIANQNEAYRTNISNEANLNRANQATNLYDKTVLTNQNFDNARSQARQNLRQSFVQAWSNRGKTQALNSMNKQYNVDPTTGFVNFTGVPGELNPTTKSQSAVDLYNEILKQPGQTPESATKLLEVIMEKK